MSTVVIDNARVMAKGQITLPRDIRNVLGVKSGDKVTLISRGGEVVILNAATYAMKYFQDGMKDAAKQAGFASEDEVSDYITKMRRETE